MNEIVARCAGIYIIGTCDAASDREKCGQTNREHITSGNRHTLFWGNNYTVLRYSNRQATSNFVYSAQNSDFLAMVFRGVQHLSLPCIFATYIYF